MNQLPLLIQDLGLILLVAGFTTLLFKRLKQPVVLGYILAGLLVSPHFPLFPTIMDLDSIHIWADIGVIVLLFSLGLEFSFKKLVGVGGPAALTAIIEISAMLGVGFLLGRLLKWPFMDCVFLGGILSIASTTIILRSFDELGLKRKRFAELVFGILIIEDLIAVVLLVLLSTISVSRQFAGAEMLGAALKLAFFLAVWFISGIFFIPTFLSKVQKHLNDETILIVSLGLCLMMVIFASLAGFSPALGAFVMGSILAETVQAERIERIITTVKNLFGAIFFVSVGMLIDPKVLVNYALPIIIITAVFIFFKTTHVALGALISGRPLKTAIYSGMSMAQIGEFSFIIATLGLRLKVTSDFLYPIAVAISAITTFTTPYMIRSAGSLYEKIEKLLPIKWKKALIRYSAGAQTITAASDWQTAIRAYIMHVAFFSAVILGAIFLFSGYVRPWIDANVSNRILGNIFSAALFFAFLMPFLWGLVMRKLTPKEIANLWINKGYRSLLLTLNLIRVIMGIVYISLFFLVVFPFVPAILSISSLIVIAFIFSKRIHRFYMLLEERFFLNFHTRETEKARINRHELAPWDAHIEQYFVPAYSPVGARTLEELRFREHFGINVAMIKRGDDYTISTPSRFEKIYPGDILFIIGTDEEIERFKKHMDSKNAHTGDIAYAPQILLTQMHVKHGSLLIGKTIRESNIREQTNGLIVGIERKGQRILNPESNTAFAPDDIIWIVGDKSLIESFRQNG